MSRHPLSALKGRAADRADLHRHRRFLALEAMAEAGDEGLPPHAMAGRNVGLLVGLEDDGLALRLPARDRLGDLRFVLTDAGREALAMAASEHRL